jgi:hypothetical protein
MQHGERFDGHASPDAAGVEQPAVGFVIAQQQRAESVARPLGVRPPDDDELGAVRMVEVDQCSTLSTGFGRHSRRRAFVVRRSSLQANPFRRTRACRHSFEGKEGGNEVDRSGEAGVGLVVASGDPAELLEPLEEVFDQVTPFVHLGVVRDRRFAVRLRRNDGQGASFIERGAQGVLVERLVGDESIKIDARYKRLDPDAVVPLARQQDEARQIAQRIDERDDLGRQPAARPADGLILSPPFAPAPCR